MDSKTPLERWKSLLIVIPHRSEVLKFFHFYRVTAYPFNPILANIDRFESDLCTYLNAHATGELRDPEKITDRWATDKSIGHVSLLLATLAAGAHYSDIDCSERHELSTDFARRSFHALRLANFLFRPSLDIIQALLILGNTLQNMGQSDAAWALLGTTIRLAQTMGLHTERSTIHCPEHVRMKARTLWSTIVWQDSLLCLCYDRPPIVSVTGWSLDNSLFERQDLSFAEVMHWLCRISLDIMRPENLNIAEFDRALEGLQRLDYAYQRGLPYLRSREHCTTLQQHLEHLALRMHTSFCVSVFCRPAMNQATPQPFLRDGGILRARAKGSLIDASKAFLDFQALSTVPLRSWSMVHTVLSSTLLLCIWEETRNDPECRNLQQKVINVFSSSDSRLNDDGTSLPESDTQWLSARHIRALVTLRSVLEREQEARPPRSENWAGMASNVMPQYGPGPLGSMDMPNPFDISPVTYLDSIMNLPMFDYTQENGFL
ncbi:Transcription factor [Penicillium griseofulvum]|uniref:Transcription factor n=1 Tax=Penicillium patulum TaxID=5078 RepID=A0A135LJK7_PENPA|nr:Transcription factor [Penicillium griseofulvum]KXG49155.1 Transcription factor [Penicillium griseofulvum]